MSKLILNILHIYTKYIYNHWIIQEFNLGIGSHVGITLGCKLCSWGLTVHPPPPSLFYYIWLLDLLKWHTFFVDYSNFSALNFKLGVQTNYPLAWMFFFCDLATAFPTSYCMETVCTCWVWTQQWCMPTQPCPSASFLMQSNWLEKKANQLLCIRKEALGTRLMFTKAMVRC